MYYVAYIILLLALLMLTNIVYVTCIMLLTFYMLHVLCCLHSICYMYYVAFFLLQLTLLMLTNILYGLIILILMLIISKTPVINTGTLAPCKEVKRMLNFVIVNYHCFVNCVTFLVHLFCCFWYHNSLNSLYCHTS